MELEEEAGVEEEEGVPEVMRRVNGRGRGKEAQLWRREGKCRG